MVTARQVVFPALHEVAVEEAAIDDERLPAGAVLVKAHCTLISAGTEGAKLIGLQKVDLPFRPGYAAVGEVLEVGAGVTDVAEGGLVFTYGNHASHHIAPAGQPRARVPKGLAPEQAVFTRMAAVAITALRVSEAEPGDTVAVIGLGTVGNFACQLFRLAGCYVIAIDVSARRLEIARECGADFVVNPNDVDLKAAVDEITHGKGTAATVEAAGNPALAIPACEITGKLGEVIWVGSPRGEHQGDYTELLNKVHLWGNGCLTFKGAHEWRYPRLPREGSKHSIQRNCRQILRWLSEGRLVTGPMHTHTIKPEEAAEAYRGLWEEKDEYLGVVIDWT